MPIVRTVAGDVESSEIGATNSHEHLFIRNGLILVQHPDYRLDDAARAAEEVQDFADAGGKTIVEATPCGLGRDPDALLAVSRETGINIIAATGVHKESYYLDSHWRFRYSVDQIAELWQSEIDTGIERSAFEGPVISRSTARAGIIKVGSDYQYIAKPTKKAFEAAAIAHAKAGAPILTHSEVGTMMMEQVEMLASFGVAPAHVIISHADRNPDWFVHRDVAQTGAFMEYDCPGRVKYFPESTIVELIRRMFELSLGDHILLGGDNARRSYWKSYGGGPGLAYLLRSFVPRLLREGFSEAQTRQLLASNASAAFAFCDKSKETGGRPL